MRLCRWRLLCFYHASIESDSLCSCLRIASGVDRDPPCNCHTQGVRDPRWLASPSRTHTSSHCRAQSAAASPALVAGGPWAGRGRWLDRGPRPDSSLEPCGSLVSWHPSLPLFCGSLLPGSWDSKTTGSGRSRHCPTVSGRDACRHSHVVRCRDRGSPPPALGLIFRVQSSLLGKSQPLAVMS